MYLSRVEIDLSNRRMIRDLKHLGCYHGWVESSFPDENDNGKAGRSRKLWRIDVINGRQYLLVLSENKPAVENLEKYGIKGSACSKNYEPFLASLQEGMRAFFRIKLNAVKSYSTSGLDKKRGRVAPVPLDELNAFFLARTEKNGFAVKPDALKIVSRDSERFEHSVESNDKKNKYLDLVGVTYEGILTVTDLAKFKQTLKRGIGKKKAYGFGLLTIIPMYGD